jgi:hypothetical protein
MSPEGLYRSQNLNTDRTNGSFGPRLTTSVLHQSYINLVRLKRRRTAAARSRAPAKPPLP